MRTDAYVFTAHCACATDMLEIETIRKTVNRINKINKQKEKYAEYRYNNGLTEMEPQSLPRYRTTLHARGPRAEYARALGKHPRAFDRELPMKFAERIDVYIHER